MDDENPPIRRLVLKKKDVDPVDKAARPGDGTAISVRLIHLENSLAAQRPAATPDATEATAVGPGLSPVFRPKDVTPTDPPSFAGDESAISVPGMLQANRTAMDDSGPQLIAMPPRRKSRRDRDFILLLSCAVVSVGALVLVFRHDMQVAALALFVIVFLTVILAWIMYGVMDRY